MSSTIERKHSQQLTIVSLQWGHVAGLIQRFRIPVHPIEGDLSFTLTFVQISLCGHIGIAEKE